MLGELADEVEQIGSHRKIPKPSRGLTVRTPGASGPTGFGTQPVRGAKSVGGKVIRWLGSKFNWFQFVAELTRIGPTACEREPDAKTCQDTELQHRDGLRGLDFPPARRAPAWQITAAQVLGHDALMAAAADWQRDVLHKAATDGRGFMKGAPAPHWHRKWTNLFVRDGY